MTACVCVCLCLCRILSSCGSKLDLLEHNNVSPQPWQQQPQYPHQMIETQTSVFLATHVIDGMEMDPLMTFVPHLR